jgi:imidazolonepropionase-like amidohydrolase
MKRLTRSLENLESKATMKPNLYLGLLILLFFSSCDNNYSTDTCKEASFDAGNYTLLKNASLFDGISEEVLKNYSVLIKDDRIYDLAPDSIICLPENVTVIPIEGRLLSPGLIESHGHQTFNEAWDTTKIKLEKLIYAGITGIRNMAGRVPSYKDWSKKMDAGEAIGPNIYSSAFFAGQAFFKVDGRLQKYRDFGDDPGQEDWMKIVDADLDIPAAVAKAKNSGADGIKLYASLPPEWVETIISEAKKHDLRVWSHAHLQLTETQQIVDLQVNSISHAEMFAHTIAPNKEVVKNKAEVDRPRVQAIFTKMIEHEIYFDVTLALYYKYYGKDSDAAIFSTQIVKMATEMGVPLVAGSDSEGFWNEGKIALYDELITLVEEAGMSTTSALKSATYNPARLLGVEEEYGSISKGKKADMVVYHASPLEDIRNISQIHLTVKDGVVYQQ